MTNQLLTPTEIRELASKLDLKPTKKLGQNFVTDQNTVEKIVRTSKVSKDSVVLEVGPGLGSLTLALLATGAKVFAVAASPGSRTYGSPSVKLQWYGEVSKPGSVSRSVFWPVPNVDSDLVQITRKKDVDQSIRKELFAVVDAAFSQRRKMLRSALSSMCAGSEKASEILESAQIVPQLRGEALNVDDYVRLTYAMKKSGITINSTRS